MRSKINLKKRTTVIKSQKKTSVGMNLSKLQEMTKDRKA